MTTDNLDRLTTVLTKKQIMEFAEKLELDISDLPKSISKDELFAEVRSRRASSISKGKNLSGNTPWKGKTYKFDGELPTEKVPPQVMGLMKYMKDSGIEGRGKEICEGAIEAGYVRSKIDPPVLFAYYAKRMMSLGMEHTNA